MVRETDREFWLFEWERKSKWCSQNQLTRNENKTKCMVFRARNIDLQHLSLNGIPINFVTDHKYLGVMLDSTQPLYEKQGSEVIKLTAQVLSNTGHTNLQS